MKNNYLKKSFAKIFALLLFVGGLIVSAHAQQGVIQFANGVTVTVKTEQTDKKNLGYANIFSSAGSGKNTVHRVLIDRKSRIYFGYDLEVVAGDAGAAKQFEVSFKPLSGDKVREMIAKIGGGGDFSERSLPKYPNNLVVQSGDTIVLDVLENPQTKEKISDSIKISRGKQEDFNYTSAESSSEKTPRDFTINDVQMSLAGFEAYVNDEKVKWNGGGVSGSVLWVYFPNKGRFIFSPVEQSNPGFQKIGRIDGKTINFSYQNVNYKFVSNKPILASGGKWNLWVMFDENYKPAANLSSDTPFSFGAANKVEYLFDNR